MVGISRRGLFWVLVGLGGATAVVREAMAEGMAEPEEAALNRQRAWWWPQPRFETMCGVLRNKIGEEKYQSWFLSMEFECWQKDVLTVSVPVKFLRSWINTHYGKRLGAAAAEVYGTKRVDIVVRPSLPPVRSAADLKRRSRRWEGRLGA